MDPAPRDERVYSPENPLELSRPLLPDPSAVFPLIEDIFRRNWVTNNGPYLQAFESELSNVCGCSMSVVTNGTIALEIAVRALELRGEVITTAFTFPATYQVLRSIPGISPVFVDIDENYCLDPEAVAEAVTPETKAILAVHAYGFPCQVDRLSEVAREFGLRLIYDAAPAFGVRIDGRNVAQFGDVSVFSFHATKVMTSLEGGAISTREPGTATKVRLLRNFGIWSEERVEPSGTNGKMDELRAAIGLLSLRRLEEALSIRERVVREYLGYFRTLNAEDIAIRWSLYDSPRLSLNYAYFPIEIRESARYSRSTVYAEMRARGINVRKYYHPSALEVLKDSAVSRGALDNTRRASQSVLCLPVHHYMSERDVAYVIETFDEIYRRYH